MTPIELAEIRERFTKGADLLNLQMAKDLGALFGAVSKTSQLLYDAQDILAKAVDEGDIDPHQEDEKCPQDDTCECKLAARLNKILEGYSLRKSKRECTCWLSFETGPNGECKICGKIRRPS